MKKSLLALAALTAFAGAASAQSSVTLFGIVDLNARSVDNATGGTRKSLSTDGIASSRIGVRGIEDIGGGLRAGFWLEGGLAADAGVQGGSNGLAAVNWNRRSTVSLLGGFGEIRLGRDYTPSFWNNTVFDVFGTNGVAQETNAWSSLGSGAITQVRANNTIGYFLPAMGGLYGQFQVAAGEGNVGSKYMGGRVGYAAGPVNFAVAYGKTDIGASPDFKEVNVGGSFDAGFATFMAQWGKQTFGSNNQKHWEIGAAVPIGALTLKASYNNFDGNLDRWDAKQIGLGVVYDLSKRTALYATYARLDNGGNTATGATFVVPGGAAGIRGGEVSTGYEFGLRHSF